MSLYDSQKALNRRVSSKGDLSGGGTYSYARSEGLMGKMDHYTDGYNSYSFTAKTTMGDGLSPGSLNAIHQKAMIIQGNCQEYLAKAEYALQTGNSADAEGFMLMARETIEQLKNCALDLRQMGQPNENVVRTMEICRDQLKGVHMALTGSMRRKKSRRAGSVSGAPTGGGAWEEPPRSYQDAMAWIVQHKRLIETAPWGDDPTTIDQQLISHQKFHSSIQRSPEVERARDELIKKGDRANLHGLDQEWDSLQQMSFARIQQLRDLQQIIQEISSEIMWVNDREEEELVFDWGDKNIDQYIPKKQESYSKLMSALEEKEKDLNKLKTKGDVLLKNNHPASDKIEAYRDTLQTQWSWLLQITKCIDIHLKENAAYSQFFKEANETYTALQKEHETVRKKFICDKETPLESLLELLTALEREREKIKEHKRQVQHLVNKSKSIVRLKPRNPEEPRSSNAIIVKAICDFKQDQKVILKDNEAILKDNSQRSKWQVTGPGGLDMMVPSVCLIIPPPNPISISLANKNEQYYEAILSVWNQLFINVKSLIAWQYCLLDIQKIKSLTITMMAKMRPEEFRQLIMSLESHYEEFKRTSQGSQLFADEDKRSIETQFNVAQAHYDQLVVQLPSYEEERRRAELRKLSERKVEVRKESVKVTKAEPVKRKVILSSSSTSFLSLSELQALRMRLEAAESTLSQHVHICLGDDGLQDCSLKIQQLEMVQRDVDLMRDVYLKLRERIMKELDGINDSDKAQFLRTETGIINQRLAGLESSASAYLQRLRALRDMLESVARMEDIVKVHEARLTEKETTSLTPQEVESYISTLKNIKSELEYKRDILSSMEGELAKATHWNGQVSGPYHRCDMMLSKYTEQVNQLSDRWRRIQAQIDTRLQDLQLYLPQLKNYQETSTSLLDWIDTTRKKQDALQVTKINNVESLREVINNQKSLNSEIIAKRGEVDSVLKDNEACVTSIKDYETDLTSYSSGLETILNVPIKRTMLKSPSMDLNLEAAQLQTRYMELLTLSTDHYKFLGELLKNMEELKIRNTKIDLLEEELRLLHEEIKNHLAKNKSLEDAMNRYQQEMSQSKNELLSMEEVKRNTALQYSATKENLDSTQTQLADLNEQLARIKYLLEEEKRKRRLAEERYTQQEEEYDVTLKKREKELETVSWSKIEVEKTVATKDREIDRLKRQLDEDSLRIKELQREMSKVRSQCGAEITNLKLCFESQIHVSRIEMQKVTTQREEDIAELQAQCELMESEKSNMGDELKRIRISKEQTDEQCKRLEEEVHNQQSIIAEEGQKRMALESQIETLMRQRQEDSSHYREELEEAMRRLQEQGNQLAYTTHSLEEESRRRKTIEEGEVVLEQTISQLQQQLSNSTSVATRLRDCEDELEKTRFEFERESKERLRLEQNFNRLQGRIKDLQGVRDSLESQVEDLRKSSQEEMAKRKQIEAEMEKTSVTLMEYTCTYTDLQHQTDSTEQRNEKELLKLQAELENSLKQNQTTTDRLTELSAELETVKQQLVEEQKRVKEANLKNEDLCKTIELKSAALNENNKEIQQLKELTEIQTKEKTKIEEELRAAQHENDDLKKAKEGNHDELSSQIAALELQLQASEGSNLDYCNLVSELTSEREKLKLETEKIQKEAIEAATGHIIDPKTNSKLTVNQALVQRLVDVESRDRLLEAEAAATGFKDSVSENRLSLYQAMKKGLIKRDTAMRLLQAQLSVGGILDPNLGVFFTKDTAIKRNLLDEDTWNALNANPKCYIDPETKKNISYEVLKNKCTTDINSGLKFLPVSKSIDPSNLIFDGVRKSISAQQLLEFGIIDKRTFDQLIMGLKSVNEVFVDKMIFLKGTGSIAGVAAGPLQKMSFTEAKKQKIMSPNCIDLLLEAQAATGLMIDPTTNEKMTVKEACAKGVVDKNDESRLCAAEAAAIGYKDPNTNNILSAGQAFKRGLIDRDTALRVLQAQEAAGGILDPILSIFFPKNIALTRNLIDEDIYHTLNTGPHVYLDPDTQEATNYISIKKKCKADPNTGLLLLPEPRTTFQGFRRQVSLVELVDAHLLEQSDMELFKEGKLTRQDIENRLRPYLRGSTCIAGIYHEACDMVMTIYQAMKTGLLRPGTTLELLEAQAASGFIIDPVNNEYLSVSDACSKGIFGPEFKAKLLSAERAVTGYIMPGTNRIISLFQAMDKGLIEKGHGIRLLEAQIASGGIIDPEHSHRIDVNVAYEKGYFNEEMNSILTDDSDDTKGFFDPNTQENLTYLELQKRCIKDNTTGLLLLPIFDRKKHEKTQKNTLRKRRVVIVDPETNKEMSVREAYDKGYIDEETFLELAQQECEWEEITSTAPDGSTQFVIVDRKTGRQFDIGDLLEQGVINQTLLQKYRSHMITLTELADIIIEKTKHSSYSPRPSVVSNISSVTSSTFTSAGPSTTLLTSTPTSSSTAQITQTRHETNPIGAIFDTDTLEKITITEAINRGLVDSITGQRLLEAQACTGGIIDPANGQRVGIQEACRMGLITYDMQNKLKPAQKAYIGFEDVKTKRKMSAVEAIKERWLPYEAGQRILEYQFVTGGLYDPQMGCRRTIQDILSLGWVDVRTAQKLQDFRQHTKNLTCPKSKLKISYKDALENCMLEEDTGVKMLQASVVSSKGISSPYNVSSAPGSHTGSRSGSRLGSRRSSVDLGSSNRYTTFTVFSSTR
ncbi:hypothetical protein NQD34_002676 [Periophthalmus magnuspinnatus]|nr:hypothetical protein NQD34_002676 [Periophthalmus magnuspinnatus]